MAGAHRWRKGGCPVRCPSPRRLQREGEARAWLATPLPELAPGVPRSAHLNQGSFAFASSATIQCDGGGNWKLRGDRGLGRRPLRPLRPVPQGPRRWPGGARRGGAAPLPPQPGERVIDLGCGFGDTTQRIAGMVGPRARPWASTSRRASSPRPARRPRRRARELLLRRRRPEATVRARASTAPSRGWARCSSPTRCAAMRNVRARAAPGRSLCMVVWRSKEDNAWFQRAEQIAETLAQHPEPDRRADLRPGPLLDGQRGHDKRDPEERRLRGDRPYPLRHTDPARRNLDQAIDLVTAIGPAGRADPVNPKSAARRPGRRSKPRLREELAPPASARTASGRRGLDLDRHRQGAQRLGLRSSLPARVAQLVEHFHGKEASSLRNPIPGLGVLGFLERKQDQSGTLPSVALCRRCQARHPISCPI